MNTQSLTLSLIASVFLFTACEEKRTSHTTPYIAEQQPRFFSAGQLETLQSDNKIIERLIFIGDAGDADKEPGLSLMKAISIRLNSLPEPETLFFLGDNIYEDGFQSEEIKCSSSYPESKKLDAQLYVGKATLNPSYFVPGNHDWDYHAEADKKILQKQQKYLEKCGRQAQLLPNEKKGTPFVSTITNDLYTAVFLDSHALMNADENSITQSFNLLKAIFELSEIKKPVLLIAHHPIATYGPHGGCYQQDFFGSTVINFFRRNGISWGQDINAKEYAEFIKQIKNLVPEKHKVMFIAGHDHSLQILSMEEGPDYSIVSGTGSKTDPVCHGENTLFAQQAYGHIEIAFRKGGEIYAEVFSFTPTSNRLNKVYSQRLF